MYMYQVLQIQQDPKMQEIIKDVQVTRVVCVCVCVRVCVRASVRILGP